jgi:hypothetical protein
VAQPESIHANSVASTPPSSSLSPEPERIDGFEFGVTLHRGMNMNMMKLHRRCLLVVDEMENQLLIRIRGGATRYWTAKVLFDRFGEMYLANGWKRFAACTK